MSFSEDGAPVRHIYLESKYVVYIKNKCKMCRTSGTRDGMASEKERDKLSESLRDCVTTDGVLDSKKPETKSPYRKCECVRACHPHSTTSIHYYRHTEPCSPRHRPSHVHMYVNQITHSHSKNNTCVLKQNTTE